MKKFLAVVLELTRNAMTKNAFPRKRIARYCTALSFRAVIGLTVLSSLDSVALGQGVLSGSAVLSGSSQLGYPTVSPLTYSARTDNCVTGAESGCVAQGGTGQPLTFLIRPSDSPPFAANAPANTAATDPDFHSYLIMVTDPTTNGSTTTSYNMGSDGEWDAFSSDSSMFMVYSNGGGPWLYYLNAAKIRARTCSPSSPCVTLSNIHGGAIGCGCSTSCRMI